MKNLQSGVSDVFCQGDDVDTLRDDLQAIGLQMKELRIKGLPRNYQLFHEALYGRDGNIAAEIAALGPAPSQSSLDEIGLKYRLVSHCGLVARKSQTDAAEMLREVAEQLAEGLQKKQSFAGVADPAYEEDGELDRLNASLSNLMLYETELTEKLRKTPEMPIEALRIRG